ncbi:phosphodiesterase [Metarhizobium album]|uniref:Phosphodiesterase n=1 Tax=Metarhizobium album TaxID=2182425 RepID=A0A2U2DFI5_9HYPH|nr:bifunctional diguanylate cyclase/phosphodiesterase [Rhizobium album]PWE52075.1 phosphodiesterase [Rhizobium album]
MGSENEVENLLKVNESPYAEACEEIARRLSASSRHHLEDEFIRYALDSAAIVVNTDVQGTITFANSKFCEISGYSQVELVGSNHRMLHSGTHDKAFFKAMYREIAQGRNWHGEICNRRKDGSLYWVDTTIVPHVNARGKIDSYTAIRFDISERKELECALLSSKEHLKQIANIDPLTGLPNRRYFQEHLETLVSEHAAGGQSFHFGLMDVDSFKEINDSFGHYAGDVLLQSVGGRLRPLGGDRLFISRVGGDEFALILVGASDEEASLFFECVLETIREPIAIGATTRRCSASIGIAACPRDAADAESLIKASDLALYQAKALGRDRAEKFQLHLRESAERKAAFLEEIGNGLKRGEFELHYQPIVLAREAGKFSLEALMRWRHPRLGLLAPGQFAEGFEDQAARAALGMFMLERIFQDVATFRAQGLPLRRVAMNLTNSDFRSDVFLDRFFELCAETGIPPEQFCVEVTEGMFLGLNQKRVGSGLRHLHQSGVEIALDDFGTGYASLTHLRHLPIDRLKIDRSFVANMATSPEDRAIIRGVIDIAHSLGKVVTAEGVETVDQVKLLHRMKCDLLQGWYFSKACPVADLAHVLSKMPTVKGHAPHRPATRHAASG